MRTAEAVPVNNKDDDMRSVKRGATWSAIIKLTPFPMKVRVAEAVPTPPPAPS